MINQRKYNFFDESKNTSLERIEFIFTLVLFALDEASEMQMNEAAKLLDQASIAIQKFCSPITTVMQDKPQ